MDELQKFINSRLGSVIRVTLKRKRNGQPIVVEGTLWMIDQKGYGLEDGMGNIYLTDEWESWQ